MNRPVTSLPVMKTRLYSVRSFELEKPCVSGVFSLALHYVRAFRIHPIGMRPIEIYLTDEGEI